MFNTAGTAFSVGNNASGQPIPAVFIFAQRNGQVTGWNPGVNRTHVEPIAGLTPTAGAAYTGLALTTGPSSPLKKSGFQPHRSGKADLIGQADQGFPLHSRPP